MTTVRNLLSLSKFQQAIKRKKILYYRKKSKSRLIHSFVLLKSASTMFRKKEKNPKKPLKTNKKLSCIR